MLLYDCFPLSKICLLLSFDIYLIVLSRIFRYMIFFFEELIITPYEGAVGFFLTGFLRYE